MSRACHTGELDVRRCFIWSQTFKKFMLPAYEPGKDKPRPATLYDDWFAKMRQALLDIL